MTEQALLIHIEDYQEEHKNICFEFFYWFSRFEFSLKENSFLREGPYNSALPDWAEFEKTFEHEYILPNNLLLLLAKPPQRQIFPKNLWKNINLQRHNSDMGKIVFIVKTIRNNLFHGGKSGAEDWDNPQRNIFLLTKGKEALDSLAKIDGNLQSDYLRHY